MRARPSVAELTLALRAAGHAHHDYETHHLRGVRDEQWPGWYAAYVLGRLGDFTTPSRLAGWLAAAPTEGDWSEGAAAHVRNELGRGV